MTVLFLLRWRGVLGELLVDGTVDNVALATEADALLRCILVGAVLRGHDGFRSAEQLLRPFLLLAGGLGAQRGTLPLVVEALATESQQSRDDIGDVARVVKLGGLEELLLRHTIGLAALEEGIDVLQLLFLGERLGDLLHAVRLQHVQDSAQEDAILDEFRKGYAGYAVIEHRLDPEGDLRLDELVALTGVLLRTQEHKSTASDTVGHLLLFLLLSSVIPLWLSSLPQSSRLAKL